MDKISEKLKEIRQKAIDKKNEHKKRMEALRAAKKAKMATRTKTAAEDENKEPIHLPKTKMQTRNKKNRELDRVPISAKPKDEEATKTKKEGNRKENKIMRICILTVSDSSSKKPELDKSGPLLAKILQKSKNLEIEILDQSILADEKELIMEYLCTYSTTADCILTTGGTGMGKRDVIPEATKEVIDRECPGIVTAILMRGLQATPFAALTRLAAGIRNNCLIVNLPGSPKAVSEGIEVLEPILPHAIALLKDKHEEIGRDHQAINSQAD